MMLDLEQIQTSADREYSKLDDAYEKLSPIYYIKTIFILIANLAARMIELERKQKES